MNPHALRHIVIVGGGTAGWMAAATLARLQYEGGWRITLVESDEIGTVGVGEATIPYLSHFHNELGIDEAEFMRATNATFKLGIEFVNWGALGERYLHGFGTLGPDVGLTKFHQYWLHARRLGLADDIEAYPINLAAARSAKFATARKDMPESPLGQIVHAYHFDATLYARFLRQFAEGLGVQRIEGRIEGATQRAEDGFVEAVVLQGGQRIEADFFIDCSGFRGLLIEQTLKTGYDDWSHYLPADSAWAVPCESSGPLLPYTRSTARDAGWQWRIPLQHRTGNGHVYASRFTDHDAARDVLMRNLDGAALAEPRRLSFTTGKRKKLWHKNVLAVGLASGFMEPLESTSIHLVQTTLVRLTQCFPDRRFAPEDIAEFNAQADAEFEKIRDFLILHYKATRRDDTPFWRHCAAMEVPASLQRRIALFESNGRIFKDPGELFTEVSWFSVMHGQGLRPKGDHALLDSVPPEKLAAFMAQVKDLTGRCVQALPTHGEFVGRYCGVGRK